MKRDIYTTDSWIALTTEPYEIRESITDYLDTNMGSTLQYIHSHVQAFLHMDIELEIFQRYMELWEQHYTTFFGSHGRILHIPVDGTRRWFHLKKTHPYSRKPKHNIIPYLSKMY